MDLCIECWLVVVDLLEQYGECCYLLVVEVEGKQFGIVEWCVDLGFEW